VSRWSVGFFSLEASIALTAPRFAPDHLSGVFWLRGSCLGPEMQQLKPYCCSPAAWMASFWLIETHENATLIFSPSIHTQSSSKYYDYHKIFTKLSQSSLLLESRWKVKNTNDKKGLFVIVAWGQCRQRKHSRGV